VCTEAGLLTLRETGQSTYAMPIGGHEIAKPTIRAYGEIKRFCADKAKRVDIENRAYWMTVTNQRSMLTVGTRFTISPGQAGLVLSYILNVQQAFEWVFRQSAEVENNLKSIGRIVRYTAEIEQESPNKIPVATCFMASTRVKSC